VLNTIRAIELMNGPQGSLVKISFRRLSSLEVFECTLMRGGANYLDLFEECQEQKKMVRLNAQVIAEGNNLISKIRECEGQINRDTTRIQSLETENSRLTKLVEESKMKFSQSSETARAVLKAQTEMRAISKEMKDVLSQLDGKDPPDIQVRTIRHRCDHLPRRAVYPHLLVERESPAPRILRGVRCGGTGARTEP
jgi:myosin heavy subunit